MRFLRLIMVGLPLLLSGIGVSHAELLDPKSISKSSGVSWQADFDSNFGLDHARNPRTVGWVERSDTHQPDVAFTPANAQGQYRYLITFAEPGLLHQAERAPGERFDADRMSAARDTLIAQQTTHRQTMGNTLDRVLEVSHHYLVTHSGLAAWLTAEEAETISRLPGVASVEREREYELATTNGPWFIGADTLWDGTNVPDNSALRGEGMVLGQLDTGIDPDHPSFANDHPICGHGQGGTPDKVLSVLDCGSTDESGLCDGENPVDTHGHGTHVAGTAIGNALDERANPPPSAPISGVAPCAHIRSYKVCPTGSCPGAAIQAGMNSILLHGDVDVMNFSISGGTDPWNDNDRRKLDLVEASVLVAVAAGNTGSTNPSPLGRVNHRGPWVLSVAASSHDGAGGSGLLSASGPGEPPDETRDIAASQGSDSPVAPGLMDSPIRHFDQQPIDFEGCTPGEDDGSGNTPPSDMAPFPEDFFTGAAALIRRGGCFFTTKIANAFDAGAELVIIRNSQSGALNMSTPGQPAVPAYSIPGVAGEALQAFVSDHPDSAVIDFEPIAGDVLASFSLRGPTPPPLQNLSKPDISAPGISIYAAVPQDVLPEGYGFLSGTSMASPHAAGSALLMRQAHPDWTVPEVMSALMTTAEQEGRKENLLNAWDPDDVGSGRVDLTKAAWAGLVMHETAQNYLDADPDTGGDVRTLNTPSLRDMSCLGECTWTRTVRNTLDVPTQWTVIGAPSPPSSEGGPGGMRAQRDGIASSDAIPPSPPSQAKGGTSPFQITIQPETFEFTGDTGETQDLTITVHPLENNLTSALNFGEVVLTETGAQAPDQHLTAAIRGRPPQPIIALDPRHHETILAPDESETLTLTIANPGEEPLEWAVTEEVPATVLWETLSRADKSGLESPSTGSGSGIDCDNQPGLIIQDTGTVDIGLGAGVGNFEQVMIVDRFTPDIVPADLTAVCLAFVVQAGPSVEIEFEIVLLDDDGPDGRPGTELGAMAVSASGFPSTIGAPVWRGFDISPLDVSLESGSVYIGARWVPSSPNFWLGADFSPVNPPGFAGGWWWVAPQDVSFPIQEVWSEYRAMFIRPVAELGSLDCTLPGWVSVAGAPNGTVDPKASQAVEIVLDADGLEPGTQKASLCMETNDPDRPLAVVPLTLTLPEQPEDLIFRDRFE